MGSVSSKQYYEIWKSELINNPDNFCLEILSYHETRKQALEEENRLQILNNAVKSNLFVNKSTARGHFGSDTSGENNPMFGKPRNNVRKKTF